jgi:hypothetical protein
LQLSIFLEKIFLSRLCCGSGSGRIRIILPDRDLYPGHADPDWYQFQANKNGILHFIISGKFQMAVKIPKNMQ